VSGGGLAASQASVAFILAYEGAPSRDGISFTGGDTLTIEGTGGSDAISVTRRGSMIFARRNTTVRSFPASRVRRLVVVGNDGNDLVTIGRGVVAAHLSGGHGNDRLFGGAGDDVLEGGAGADDLSGGGGVDTADYFRKSEDLRIDFDGVADDGAAGEGDNVRGDMENVTGGHGDDEITGNSKNNRLLGGPGDDRLVGLAGDDWLDGGLGADFMSGGQGVDTIDYSWRPRDPFNAQGVVVTLADESANDGIPGEGDNAQADNLIGTPAFDRITGSESANVIDGGAGNDVLAGLGGDDTLRGGLDADRLDGGLGNDLLDGGADPGYGPNIDTADYSARGEDLTIDLTNGSDLTAAGERDRFAHIDNVEGGSGDDRIIGDDNPNTLLGNAGDDTLIGNGGNDVFDGGAGADAYHGGGGRDTADYTRRTEDLVISLDNAADDGAAGERDDVRGDVEIVNSGSGDDRITGSSAINTFRGGDGDDDLDGGTGDDQLFGGGGDDVLTGSAGTDRLNGEDGNDTLFARDGTTDILNGGSGTDRARKDDADSVTGVETLLA
jgi:Ca2+-binding RTX toxin-like protein